MWKLIPLRWISHQCRLWKEHCTHPLLHFEDLEHTRQMPLFSGLGEGSLKCRGLKTFHLRVADTEVFRSWWSSGLASLQLWITHSAVRTNFLVVGTFWGPLCKPAVSIHSHGEPFRSIHLPAWSPVHFCRPPLCSLPQSPPSLLQGHWPSRPKQESSHCEDKSS